MDIERHQEGGVFLRSRTYWKCSQSFCGHKELEEGTTDKYIRMGLEDETLIYIPLTDTENND